MKIMRMGSRWVYQMSKAGSKLPLRSVYKRTSSKTILIGDFTGGPVVKTSPYNADGMGLIPCWGAKISHASRPKKKNIKQNNMVKSSMKKLKMVHIKTQNLLKKDTHNQNYNEIPLPHPHY